MNMKHIALYALGFMGLQAADQFPPGYASAPQALGALQYQQAQTALQQLQLGAHESSTDCYRTTGSLPVQPQGRQAPEAGGHVLQQNDVQKKPSLLKQIEQLPSLSQAPMQKLLSAALELQKLSEQLVQAHLQGLKELENTPGTNTQVRQVAEQQLPKARKRVDESMQAMTDAIGALTKRMQKAKK